MAKRIKGKCKYCGKEYTMSYMNKHLANCKARQDLLAAETGMRRCGYFTLAIYPKYSRDYWLFIEMRETATLKDLDTFLRDIWLECCGHLSAFDINGISYELIPLEDSFWDEPARGMNYKLRTVLQKGMTIGYEYDFGSTTELLITAVNYRIGYWKMDKLTILSRNNPPVLICDECGENPVVAICAQCAWTGSGLLCEECSKTHACGEEVQLDVCNSPRMGVCGYCGSRIYPDQFISDADKKTPSA